MYGTGKIESFYQHIPLNDGWGGVALSSQSGFSASVSQSGFSQSHPIRAGGTHPFGIPGISPSLMKGLG